MVAERRIVRLTPPPAPPRPPAPHLGAASPEQKPPRAKTAAARVWSNERMTGSASEPVSGLDDRELLTRFVRAGEAAALGELARRHEPWMLALARARSPDRRDDLAREAVQETWVRVIRFASGYREEASVKTWLYRVLLSRCRDAAARDARRARREKRASATAPGGPGELSGGGSPAGAGGGEDGAADAVEREELVGRVRAALDRLSDDRRDVVLLCHHRRMTHTDAAAVLGVPVGTVKTRLYAAMDELRALLGATAGADRGKAGRR